MRVISGIYGGRGLKSPSGFKIRPTTDRLRESLFSILTPRIESGTRFLDLCAGTGAVGIEALSRGAGFAAFVDRSRKACALIEYNLDAIGVPEQMTVVRCEQAVKYLAAVEDANFDIAFYDPPYDEEYERVLGIAGDNNLVNAGGLLIVEHHAKREVGDLYGELRRWRIVKQGETFLSFFERD